MLLSVVVLISLHFARVRASVGDRLPDYRSCVTRCLELNCSDELSLKRYEADQTLSSRLLMWRCADECRYSCMWATVDGLIAKNYTIPQFHGKWPFVRLFGMQEPASVFFSLLNLASYAYMLGAIVREVPSDAPMYSFWIVYSLIAIFAWVWSSVFHSRDTDLTEKMDYFCAFACVLYAFYCCLVRCALLMTVLCHTHIITAIFTCERSRSASFTIGAPLLAYFVYHVYYLGFVRFDYGYNMSVNVLVGVLNSLAWLSWSAYMYVVRKTTFVGYCVTVVFLAMCFLALELADFPPFLWTIDAHSLWHLSTAPLPLLWTRFVVADCRYACKSRKSKQI